MKIDRRSFLALGAGATAGITLSPLPWKLMDDSSIWSQNWPWTPVPADGEITYENSVCTLCPGHCGISVRKIENRIVKIEGIKDHPVNDGSVCLLGLSGLQLLYGPTRVKSPMKKDNGKLRKISWEEAISIITEKLIKLRSKGLSNSVACITGSDSGTMPQLLKRFLKAYGSPNFIATPSSLDTYSQVIKKMHGVNATPGFDVDNADFILSFGSGIVDGWGSPVHMFKAYSKWKNNGTEFFQIEPRLSNTAAVSGNWVPIQPGTEFVLAMGIANVILSQELYDQTFVNRYTSGFKIWKRIVLQKFGLDNVSKITGIEKIKIVEMARKFAKASKPLALCGKGDGSHPGSFDEFVAVHSLNALVGNINKKGGVWAWAIVDSGYLKWPEIKMDSLAKAGNRKSRIDGARSKKYPDTKYLLNRLPEIINSKSESKVQCLFVADANPRYTMTDSKTTNQAFDKIPFVVSFSSFMDETASKADLVLPSHINYEKFEDVSLTSALLKPSIGLSKPVTPKQCDTKYIGDIVIEIARKLEGSIAESFPWENYEACLGHTLGDNFDKLKENGYLINENYTLPGLNKAFKTSTGKFNFTFPENLSGNIGLQGDAGSFPLVLLPYDSIRLVNGYIGTPPFGIKVVSDKTLKGNDILVEVNPVTAKKFGLTECKKAVLSTPKGKIHVKVHISEGIVPGVVGMARGLGHTAYDKYLSNKGVNVNEVIGQSEDPVTGLDSACGIKAGLAMG